MAYGLVFAAALGYDVAMPAPAAGFGLWFAGWKIALASLLFDYLRLLPRLRRAHHREMQFDGAELVWPGVSFSAPHYQRYIDFFGLKDARETERVHPLYFYVLGQRAQLKLLAHQAFPFAAAGLVHMSNNVILQRPLDIHSPYDLALHARCLQLTPAGYELEIVTTFSQQGETVAVNTTLALARAPLRRERRAKRQAHDRQNEAAAGKGQNQTADCDGVNGDRAAPAAKPTSRRQLPEACLSPGVSLVMPAWAGKRYAKISGDYNPIHLSPWLSRWFGFRRPIAHGMYSLMRVVSVVERQEGMQAQEITVQFVRPVYLPSTSSMAHELLGERCHFELTDRNGHLQLRGSLR